MAEHTDSKQYDRFLELRKGKLRKDLRSHADTLRRSMEYLIVEIDDNAEPMISELGEIQGLAHKVDNLAARYATVYQLENYYRAINRRTVEGEHDGEQTTAD